MHLFINIFGLEISAWYIMLVTGIITAIVVFKYICYRDGIDKKTYEFYVMIGIISIGSGLFFGMMFDNFYHFLAGRPFWLGIGVGGITMMGGIIGGIGCFLIITTILTTPDRSKVALGIAGGVLGIGIGAVALGAIFGERIGVTNSFVRPTHWVLIGAALGAVVMSLAGVGVGHLIQRASHNPMSYYMVKMYSPQYRVAFWPVFNSATIGLVLAAGIGRIGCFFAGCCYGDVVPQGSLWGFLGASFNHGNSVGQTVFATNLMESVFMLTMGIVLFVTRKQFKNQVLVFAYGYSAFRFLLEFLRGDNRGAFVFGLSPSQWLSVLFILVGVALHVYMNKTGKVPFDDDNNNKYGNTMATA